MKKIIHTPLAPAAVGPYSQAVEAGNTLYISGQLPIDPATGKIEAQEIKEQTRQVLKNIGALLDAAGYTFDDVVQSTCFMQNLGDFAAMNEIYATFYKQDPPARITYEVSKLPLGSLIEIATVAVKTA